MTLTASALLDGTVLSVQMGDPCLLAAVYKVVVATSCGSDADSIADLNIHMNDTE